MSHAESFEEEKVEPDVISVHTAKRSIDIESGTPVLNKTRFSDLDRKAPYPHRAHNRSLTIYEAATQGTIKDGQTITQRERDLRIQRTNSISLANGPMKGDREARTVADFRTLSLGIHDTRKSEDLARAQRRGKKEVKGW